MITKIDMTLKKSTKGTYVYEDKSENAVIPSVYIRKHGLPNPPPNEIIITIVTSE
jgi:hypothetical protein